MIARSWIALQLATIYSNRSNQAKFVFHVCAIKSLANIRCDAKKKLFFSFLFVTYTNFNRRSISYALAWLKILSPTHNVLFRLVSFHCHFALNKTLSVSHSISVPSLSLISFISHHQNKTKIQFTFFFCFLIGSFCFHFVLLDSVNQQ